MENERKRRLRILLDSLKEKTIYLYGAGIRGKVALENLNDLEMDKNIAGFIDDYSQQRKYCGKDVWLTEEVADFNNANSVYIITTYAVAPMVCNLIKKGIASRNIYYFPELLINDVKIEKLRENADKIEQAYTILDDCLSKYIYKTLFEICLNGNIGVLSRTKGNTQYFPMKDSNDAIENFMISESESFVDCGAYDGDTIRQFKIKTNDRYKKIWAFEPDKKNFVCLADYVEKEQDDRVQIIQGGVYSENTVMFFSGSQGTTSTLDLTGDESIQVYQLDSVIQEPVTFIKMDIEGSEREALLGAKRIISEYKPKLAICIYHNIEDFWEIPLLIKRLNPDYHIYIRNYEDRIDETVCYAI